MGEMRSRLSGAIEYLRSRKAPRARGFTLIEILLASVVFLIGISGVLAITLQTGRATARANSKMTADLVGNNLLELVGLLSYQSAYARLNSSWTTYYNRQGINIGSASGAFFTATASLLSGSNSGQQMVQTVVTWTEPSSRESMSYSLIGPLSQTM